MRELWVSVLTCNGFILGTTLPRGGNLTGDHLPEHMDIWVLRGWFLVLASPFLSLLLGLLSPNVKKSWMLFRAATVPLSESIYLSLPAFPRAFASFFAGLTTCPLFPLLDFPTPWAPSPTPLQAPVSWSGKLRRLLSAPPNP